MEQFRASQNAVGTPLDSLENYMVDTSAMNSLSEHPDFKRLTGLVSEAVLEVVCVALLGYIVARRGMFDANAQKMVANLNIMIFTPCLIFSKLAKQLTGEKLIELSIIPVILLVQTGISFVCSKIIVRLFRIKTKPQRNFVTAMAVFGNSNSLPLSLVISLSQTISGLHWSKVPGDNDNEVAARGILYLLVFSQLGQALRWSWGMNSLLKPESEYTPAERGEIPRDNEEGAITERYSDNPDEATQADTLIDRSTSPEDSTNSDNTIVVQGIADGTSKNNDADVRQRTMTRAADGTVALSNSTVDGHTQQGLLHRTRTAESQISMMTKTNRTVAAYVSGFSGRIGKSSKSLGKRVFQSLPIPLQKFLSVIGRWIKLIGLRIIACLNVPLAAIIISVIVATIPKLQAFFFTKGTFLNNTVAAAITQTGGVAVPLILVVLGANLAKNTLPDEGYETSEKRREKRNMLVASLLSRLVIPVVIMTPLLALTARYVPFSILEDPIFIIVCFLLAGAPSALQLAQMCQVNDLYVPVISKLLMHSYVIWIFPTTLVLVMLALEVVNFAAQR